MEKLLTYALKDGILTNIKDVKNGYECGCICPKCGEELSAVANIEGKDYKKGKHFSHKPESNCSGSYESALHLLVKDVFAETKEIFVPDFHHDYNPSNKKSFYEKGGQVLFETVSLEEEISFEEVKFKPDAIATVKGKSLFVEFAVTSFCNEDKRSKIRRSKIPAIEIAIDPIIAILDPEYVRNMLLEDNSFKYFLFNPRLDERYKKEQQDKLEKDQQREEEDIKLEKVRITNLIQCKKYNILLIKNGQVSQCPKNNDFFNYFKNSEYFEHPVIKKLVGGASWNGRFYNNSFGRHIFVDNEKVITRSDFDSHQEFQEREVLFKGLMEYKRRKEKSVDNCDRCSYKKGINTINGEDYITCSYVNKSNPIIEAKIQ